MIKFCLFVFLIFFGLQAEEFRKSSEEHQVALQRCLFDLEVLRDKGVLDGCDEAIGAYVEDLKCLHRNPLNVRNIFISDLEISKKIKDVLGRYSCLPCRGPEYMSKWNLKETLLDMLTQMLTTTIVWIYPHDQKVEGLVSFMNSYYDDGLLENNYAVVGVFADAYILAATHKENTDLQLLCYKKLEKAKTEKKDVEGLMSACLQSSDSGSMQSFKDSLHDWHSSSIYVRQLFLSDLQMVRRIEGHAGCSAVRKQEMYAAISSELSQSMDQISLWGSCYQARGFFVLLNEQYLAEDRTEAVDALLASALDGFLSSVPSKGLGLSAWKSDKKWPEQDILALVNNSSVAHRDRLICYAYDYHAAQRESDNAVKAWPEFLTALPGVII